MSSPTQHSSSLQLFQESKIQNPPRNSNGARMKLPRLSPRIHSISRVVYTSTCDFLFLVKKVPHSTVVGRMFLQQLHRNDHFAGKNWNRTVSITLLLPIPLRGFSLTQQHQRRNEFWLLGVKGFQFYRTSELTSLSPLAYTE